MWLTSCRRRVGLNGAGECGLRRLGEWLYQKPLHVKGVRFLESNRSFLYSKLSGNGTNNFILSRSEGAITSVKSSVRILLLATSECIVCVRFVTMPSGYKQVISREFGMYGKYCT